MYEFIGYFIYFAVCFGAALIIRFFVYRAMDKIMEKRK
jgi:hypothetical protein